MRVVSCLTLCLVGCAPDEIAEATCTDAPIAFTIGTGSSGFVALAANETVTVAFGPQGGWHIETGALIAHSEPEVAVHTRILVPALDNLEIAGNQQATYIALAGYDADACEGVVYGINALIDPDPGAALVGQALICALEGETLQLIVEVQDIVSGRVHSASLDVVAALSPVDVARCGR